MMAHIENRLWKSYAREVKPILMCERHEFKRFLIKHRKPGLWPNPRPGNEAGTTKYYRVVLPADDTIRGIEDALVWYKKSNGRWE